MTWSCIRVEYKKLLFSTSPFENLDLDNYFFYFLSETSFHDYFEEQLAGFRNLCLLTIGPAKACSEALMTFKKEYFSVLNSTHDWLRISDPSHFPDFDPLNYDPESENKEHWFLKTKVLSSRGEIPRFFLSVLEDIN